MVARNGSVHSLQIMLLPPPSPTIPLTCWPHPHHIRFWFRHMSDQSAKFTGHYKKCSDFWLLFHALYRHWAEVQYQIFNYGHEFFASHYFVYFNYQQCRIQLLAILPQCSRINFPITHNYQQTFYQKSHTYVINFGSKIN